MEILDNLAHLQRKSQYGTVKSIKMFFVSKFCNRHFGTYCNIKSNIEGENFLRTYKLRSSLSECRSSYNIVVPQEIVGKKWFGKNFFSLGHLLKNLSKD